MFKTKLCVLLLSCVSLQGIYSQSVEVNGEIISKGNVENIQPNKKL